MPCATPMLPAYTNTLRPASAVSPTTIVLGASAGAPSQFCSTSSRLPGFCIQEPKYAMFPGVCTPITSATEYG